MRKLIVATLALLIIASTNSYSVTLALIIKGYYQGIEQMGSQRDKAWCVGTERVCIDYRDYGIPGSEDNGYMLDSRSN